MNKHDNSNKNSEPIIRTSFVYHGETINVEFFDIANPNDMPDIDWDQVYGICNLNGMVPLVTYDSDNDNLPGGHVKSGETAEECLARELREEICADLVEFVPLGYQRLTDKNGNEEFQLRCYALVRNKRQFIRDPDGQVVGNILVNLDEVENHIKYGKVGEFLINKVRPYFKIVE